MCAHASVCRSTHVQNPEVNVASVTLSTLKYIDLILFMFMELCLHVV